MLVKAMRDERPSQQTSTIVPFKPNKFSKTWTFFDGDWHEGNAPIMGARSHATWLGTMVFDGARAFEGVAPDLDLHCARVNNSAAVFSLKQMVAGRGVDRPRARGHQALRPQCRALHPPDVLGGDRIARRRAP